MMLRSLLALVFLWTAASTIQADTSRVPLNWRVEVAGGNLRMVNFEGHFDSLRPGDGGTTSRMTVLQVGRPCLLTLEAYWQVEGSLEDAYFDYRIHATAPPGYEVRVDSLRGGYQGAGVGLSTHWVTVVPSGSTVSVVPGQFYSVETVEDRVVWTVSAGLDTDGAALPAVRFFASPLQASSFQRSQLSFITGTSGAERVPSGNAPLRQILTPHGLMDVTDIPGGLRIHVFRMADVVVPKVNGVYAVLAGATPVVSYEFATPNPAQSPTTQFQFSRTRPGEPAEVHSFTRDASGAWQQQLPLGRGTMTTTSNVLASTETSRMLQPDQVVAREQTTTFASIGSGGLREPVRIETNGRVVGRGYVAPGVAGRLGAQGFPEWTVDETGGWIVVDYHHDPDARQGNVRRIYKPWLDLPATVVVNQERRPPLDETTLRTGRWVEFTYAAAADENGRADLLAERVERIGTHVVGRTVVTHDPVFLDAATGWRVRRSVIDEYASPTTFVRRTEWRYVNSPSNPEWVRGRLRAVMQPDGAMTSFVLQQGFVTGVGTTLSFVASSTPTAGSRPAFRQVEVTGFSGGTTTPWFEEASPGGGPPMHPLRLVAGQSSATVTVLVAGQPEMERTLAYSPGLSPSTVPS